MRRVFHIIINSICGLALCVFPLCAEEHTVNFGSVPVAEVVRFVSRVAEVNFLVDPSLLNFNVNFISGKAASPEELLHTLIVFLEQHQLEVRQEHGHYIVREKAIQPPHGSDPMSSVPTQLLPHVQKQGQFTVYKLQYHPGDEILDALKQMASQVHQELDLVKAAHSIHWIKSTNSLVISGEEAQIAHVCDMIRSLDTPLKQVLIEILVLETSLNNSLDFGVQWSAKSKFKEGIGVRWGNNNAAADAELPETESPFQLGIIGDILFHKGQSFLSLGSLISALQTEGGSSIVFNQKIIAQENKPSHFFVGDNIPFAGSIVKMLGQGQQTTANIEYKDIGVNINITPLIGSNDVVTLQINQEITEAVDHKFMGEKQVSGIQTTKSQMNTHVHVPDQHYVILSGMSKSYQTESNANVPWLASAPIVGRLFRSKETREEKRNILIFVRPQLMQTLDGAATT